MCSVTKKPRSCGYGYLFTEALYASDFQYFSNNAISYRLRVKVFSLRFSLHLVSPNFLRCLQCSVGMRRVNNHFS